jgi:uncharacterized membrane protein (UPF0127 family)
MFVNLILRSVYVYIAALFIVLAVVTGYYFSRTAHTIELTLGNAVLTAWVADTAHLREVGLGGKTHLAENQAMLFVFDTDGLYSFWMKDMQIPIDIAWLDADKRVVYLLANVSPDTYERTPPQVFTPPVAARYVVEMAAGNAAKLGLGIGSSGAW